MSIDYIFVFMYGFQMLLVGVFSLTFPTTTHPAMFLPTLLLANQMMGVLGRGSVPRRSGVRSLTVIEKL